jgi:hypothetical protein
MGHELLHVPHWIQRLISSLKDDSLTSSKKE